MSYLVVTIGSINLSNRSFQDALNKVCMLLAIITMMSCTYSHTDNSQFQEFKTQPAGHLRAMLNSEISGVSGNLDLLTPEVGRKPFLHKKIKGENQKHSWWDGESAGNWLEGAVSLAYIAKDSSLKTRLEMHLDSLILFQSKDPQHYLGLYHSDGDFRWKSYLSELWPQSRIYLTFIAAYKATNNKEYLQAVELAAQQTIQYFPPSYYDTLEYRKRDTHAAMIIEPMVALYKITGNQEYLDYAIKTYESLKNNIDLGLSEVPYIHGVHLTENIRLPAMIGELCQDKDLIRQSQDLLDLFQDNYVSCTGMVRADEKVSFTRPNRGTEYCTMVEWFISNTATGRITKNMEYFDHAELTFYNGAQGARMSDGTGIQYLSYPNQLHADSEAWFGNKQLAYSYNHWPLCCNPNAARLLPYFLNRMYILSPDSEVLVAMYGPSSCHTVIDDIGVELTQETKYPFDNDVIVTIDPDESVFFKLSLRIPGWASSYQASINGSQVQFQDKNGTISIQREWKRNDKVKVSFKSDIVVKRDLNELASIKYGPLIYVLPIKADTLKRYCQQKFCNYSFRMQKEQKWNYALNVHVDSIAAQFINNDDYDSPWVRSPIQIKLEAWRIPNWSVEGINQPPTPPSPFAPHWRMNLTSDTISLIPFGATRLRISAFPMFYNKEKL